MISDIASAFTRIYRDKRSGRSYGICPFCKSTTPTFFMDDKVGTFCCYACGKHGTEQDLRSALTPKRQQPIKQVSSNMDPTLAEINEKAAGYYYSSLTQTRNAGAEYLKRRGLTRDVVDMFGLGFAPAKPTLSVELSKRYPKDVLLKSGLFKETEEGGIRDFFRNRVMFPIMNEAGDVIAFGGRTLYDDVKPKYMNSPETDAFSKRKNLYGFPYHLAERSDAIIICEGYMDLIALQSHGFEDSAAVLGTALTKEHVQIISSYYKKVYLSLDSDQAGIHAAKRSIAELVNAGVEVSVLSFTPAKDPDEFIRRFGAEAFQQNTQKSISAKKFIARHCNDISELVNLLKELD